MIDSASRDAVDDWVIRPDESGVMSIEQIVANHVTGILSMHYPGPHGTKLRCHPKAIEKLGGPIFEKIENIVAEVQMTGRTATLQIVWRKGIPDISVVSSKIIIP